MDTLSGWQSEFSVGHPKLDSEHRQLLGLCRSAVMCAAENTPQCRAQFHTILDELANYARRHFANEEAVLAGYNYPFLDAQQAAHLDYQEKVTDFLLSATFGDLDRAGVARFLQSWWTEHILVDDMRYRDFLIENHGGLR